MSVVCIEHEGTPRAHLIETTAEAFCVTTRDCEEFTVICLDALDAIPAEKRWRRSVTGGLDVHRMRNCAVDELVEWSINAETARRYLPNSSLRYIGATP